MGDPVVLIGGWYDCFRTADLQAELALVKPHSDVVLDLSRTQHLDCACLGVLIKNLNAWRAYAPGTRLRLVNVAPRIQRMLQLLDLDRVFVIEQTSR